jgi:hypothetical protein
MHITHFCPAAELSKLLQYIDGDVSNKQHPAKAKICSDDTTCNAVLQGRKRVLKRDFKQKRDADWEEQPNRAQNWGSQELTNPAFNEYYKAQVPASSVLLGYCIPHAVSTAAAAAKSLAFCAVSMWQNDFCACICT